MAKKVFYTKELGRLVASNADGSLETKYHVVSTFSGGWGVLRHGKRRPCKYFRSKKDAIAFGKKYAVSKSAVALVIHGEDGDVIQRILLNPKKTSSVNGVRK